MKKIKKILGLGEDNNQIFFWLMFPSFLILFSITILPLIGSILSSLLEWNLSKPNERSFIGLQNFIELFTDGDFWYSAFLTLYQVGGTVIGQLILGTLMALLLARQFRGVKFLRSLYLIPMMTTPIVAGLIWKMLFNTERGMINYFLSFIGIDGPNWLGNSDLAMPAIIITDLWLSTPFVTIILLAGIMSISTDYTDAAKVDGANAFQSFWHITLPLLKPMIWLALLFRVMDAIKRFDTIYVMTGGGPGRSTETLDLHAYFYAFEYLDIGHGAAVAIIMLIIMFTLSLFILRSAQRSN